jgi:CRISPR-associated protein Csd1
MFLRRLKDYAKRISGSLAPAGYDFIAIKWIIPLDIHGKLTGDPIPTAGKKRKNDPGKLYRAPHRLRTSTAIRPKLLADIAEYVLGIPKTDTENKIRRAAECHQAFVQLVFECAEETREPSVAAVRDFLREMRAPLGLPKDFDQSHSLTFSVDGVLPIDLPSVREFWARYFWQKVLAGEREEPEDEQAERRPQEEESETARPSITSADMQCLVCGKTATPVPRHPFQIKRLPGRPAGAALISANVKAFESYGLAESLIAPTCKECAEAYAKGANALIEGSGGTSISVGPCLYIFWTREEHGFSPASLLSTPDPGEVKALVSSAWRAKPDAIHLDEEPFYAAALTANQGRVVVRDWLETTVAHAKKSLARWFQLQATVGDWGEGAVFPLPIRGYKRDKDGRWIEGLAECTAPRVKRRRDIERVSPALPTALLHVALHGGPLPSWILAEAVKRDRAEQAVTRPRAALIKMVLLSQRTEPLQEDTMIELDTDNRNPAYLCGRLMAILEGIQRAALGEVGANVTSRFFGTASSAPASVFGKLLRDSQHHLGRLRKEKRGAYEALQRRIEEVTASLPAFPKVLSLEDQGLFSLGYFHQRAADRGAAIAHKHAGQAGPQATNDENSNEKGETQ